MTNSETTKDNSRWFFLHGVIIAFVMYVIITTIFFSALFFAVTGTKYLLDNSLKVRRCESGKVKNGGVTPLSNIHFVVSCGDACEGSNFLPLQASSGQLPATRFQIPDFGFQLSAASDRLTDYIPFEEQVVIENAARRNKCFGDDFLILLAIRKAENGRAGLEFGVLDPKAINTNLDTQAGWAAATIVKNRTRWEIGGCTALRGGDQPGNANASGGADEFITYLGQRYCPPKADPINRHWAGNVKFWFKRFKDFATESTEITEEKTKTKKV